MGSNLSSRAPVSRQKSQSKMIICFYARQNYLCLEWDYKNVHSVIGNNNARRSKDGLKLTLIMWYLRRNRMAKGLRRWKLIETKMSDLYSGSPGGSISEQQWCVCASQPSSLLHLGGQRQHRWWTGVCPRGSTAHLEVRRCWSSYGGQGTWQLLEPAGRKSWLWLSQAKLGRYPGTLFV